MTTRLPVVSPRPAFALRQAARAEAGPRVAVSRALLCVGSGGHDGPALQFACALVRELAARQCGAAVIVEPGATRAAAALRTAGAAEVVELAPGDLVQLGRAALDALPEGALVIGWGAQLAIRFEALLSVAVDGSFAGADLELTGPSDAVASAIGAWLAQRGFTRTPVDTEGGPPAAGS